MGKRGSLHEREVVRDAYGVNYSQLAALKAQLDPKNLFRMNQNITPSA